MHEITYTSAPELRRPGVLFRRMAEDLWVCRELAWRLLVRNLSAQYRQTLLGYVWAFLPVIATTLTFTMLDHNNVFNGGKTGPPYPLFVTTGMILWLTFTDALNSPLKLVETSKVMLAKINFPREALILAGVGEVIFNLLMRLIVLAAALAYYRWTPPWTVLLAPAGMLGLTALGLVFGILVTPFGVLYQDVSRGIMLITSFWMFLTPVVYPPLAPGAGGWAVRLNPVTPVLAATRDWLIAGPSPFGVEFLWVTGFTVFTLAFGWLVFRLSLPHLVARIGG